MNKGINLYVGNVARNVSEEQLRSLFSQYGAVTAVKIIKDRMTGEMRGFAFVDMDSTNEGQAAISALNGYELEGQRLRVNEARPREEGGPRGGGFDRPRRPFNGGGGGNRGPRY